MAWFQKHPLKKQLYINNTYTKNMKNVVLYTLLAVGILACDSKEKDKEQSQKTPIAAQNTVIEKIVAIGKVEPESEIIDLSAPASGIVSGVFKKDGDQVKKGETLIALFDTDESNAINEINTQKSTQLTRIQADKADLKEKQVSLARKREQAETAQRLLEKGAETKENYDNLLTDVKLLEVAIERVKATIELTNKQTAEYDAKLKTAKSQSAKRIFKAPTDGLMLDMKLNPGEAVTQYNTYAEFAPAGNLVVRAEIDEMYNSLVAIGQLVDIVSTGTDKILAKGKVIMVSPYLKKKSIFSEKTDDQEDRRVRQIKVELQDSKNLVINSKIECIIKL
jgi:multidrug resistance efflux pump